MLTSASRRRQRRQSAPVVALRQSHRLRRYCAAVEQAYLAVNAADPTNEEATQLLGLSYYLGGHPADAIHLLEKVQRWYPRANVDASYILGVCYIQTKDYPQARKAFAKMFDVPADSAASYLFTARMLLRQEYDPIAEDKGVALLTHSVGELSAYGDRDLLIEAVANLVDNAVKLTPKGGRVEIALLRGNAESIVRVKDTGSGISEAERDVVLKRFYRSDKLRSAPGFGLCLNLVAAIIKLHGFRLTIHPGPGCVIEIASPDQNAGGEPGRGVETAPARRLAKYARFQGQPIEKSNVP